MPNIVWKDRKRTLFGLPWSFTKYSLSDDRLFISTGFLSTKEDEVRLYRIMDISLKRTLGQRIFGHYTLEEMDAAKHSCDLPRHDYLTVNIDGGQQGVGGDVPAVATLRPQDNAPWDPHSR